MVFTNMMNGFGVTWIFFFLICAGITIFAFVFWILMLVDCVKRKFKDDSEKIIWVLVLVFTGIIGALIYYFIVKNKKKR
ncbi:MAG: PLDc N-terminal domain-containing protein [Nanoarchaeota archaeon]